MTTKTLRRAIESIAVNAAFLALLYIGFVGDAQGARHVVVFTVWVLNLPAGILTLADDDVQRKLAEVAELPAVCLFVRLVVQYATLGALVWSGYIVTAIAWVVWMICARAFRERVRQIRAESLENMKTMFIIHPHGKAPRVGYPIGDEAASLRELNQSHPGAAIYVLQAPDVPPPGTAVVVTAEEFLAIDDAKSALSPQGRVRR